MATSTPFSIGETSSGDEATCSKKAPRQQQPGANSAETREKYHSGSLKWGKYKKREQEAKKKRRANQENIGVKSEGGESALSSGALDLSSDSYSANMADAQVSGSMKENFDFPDGGWVCSQCQNYNFKGRVKCNRCHKSKSGCDQDGKPKHLIRQTDKESVQQQPPKRKQAISESDLPHQCYGKI